MLKEEGRVEGEATGIGAVDGQATGSMMVRGGCRHFEADGDGGTRLEEPDGDVDGLEVAVGTGLVEVEFGL